MAKAGLVQADSDKVKIWQSDYPKEFPVCGYWPLPPTRFAIQNDCADDQNPGSSSRDMGDKGSVLLKDKNVALHRSFEQQLFTRNDGNWSTRIVLSSYTFMANGAQGIPDGLSDCSRCTGSQCTGCKSVPFTPAHDPSACGYTVGNATSAWAEGVYVLPHYHHALAAPLPSRTTPLLRIDAPLLEQVHASAPRPLHYNGHAAVAGAAHQRHECTDRAAGCVRVKLVLRAATSAGAASTC